MLGLAVNVGCGSSGAGSRDATGTSGAAGTSGVAGTSGAAGSSAGVGADGAATGAAGTGAGVDARCSETGRQPDLLLLLDRSGSMMQALDGTSCPSLPVVPECVTRWAEVTKAVSDVVQEGEGTMRWGLKFFPNDQMCGVTPDVAVPVGDRSAAAIALSIAATAPVGRTPTRLAVQSAAAYVQGLTDPNPKAIVLATDGAPNCAPTGGDTTAIDRAGAVAAIQAVAESGIPVYVIGIGNVTQENDILREMAMAGGRAQTAEPRYYPIGSRADLVAALRTISAQVAADAGTITTCP